MIGRRPSPAYRNEDERLHHPLNPRHGAGLTAEGSYSYAVCGPTGSTDPAGPNVCALITAMGIAAAGASSMRFAPLSPVPGIPASVAGMARAPCGSMNGLSRQIRSCLLLIRHSEHCSLRVPRAMPVIRT